MNVDADIGIFGIHAGASSGQFPKLVHYGVFGLEGDVLGVGEISRKHGRIHGEGVIGIHVGGPVNASDLEVERSFVEDLEAPQGQEDAEGGAQFEVSAIEEAQIAAALHGAGARSDILGADGVQFSGEDLFEPGHSFDEKFQGISDF